MLRLAAMLLMLLAVPALADTGPLPEDGEIAMALAAKHNYPAITTYVSENGVTYTVMCSPSDNVTQPPNCMVFW